MFLLLFGGDLVSRDRQCPAARLRNMYYDVTCGWGPYDTLDDYLENAVYFRIFRAIDSYTVQINHYLDESDFDVHYDLEGD